MFPGKQMSSRLLRSRGKSQCPFNAGIGLSLPLHLAACWWDLSYETLHKELSVHSSTCLQRWPRDLARTKDLPFQVDSICGSLSHLKVIHPVPVMDARPSYFPCGWGETTQSPVDPNPYCLVGLLMAARRVSQLFDVEGLYTGRTGTFWSQPSLESSTKPILAICGPSDTCVIFFTYSSPLF